MSFVFGLVLVLFLASTNAQEYIRFHPKKIFEPYTPQWPSRYSVQGTLNLPYAELSEPFTAWFDADLKSSRIDYYGGNYS